MMPLQLLVVVPALLIPSQLPASRIVASRCVQTLPVWMCDGAEEAAEVEVADAAAESSAAPPARRARAPKMPIDELEVGSTVEGTIRSVQSYGAFVDLGAATDGLLHVSEMSDEFVKDANEMFKVGDKVSVRIKGVNTEKGQVALSCKSESEAPRRRAPRSQPDLSEFENADDKAFIAGTVNSITSYGAFITLKEGVDGLVHISAIQEGGVGKVEDVLQEGQAVQVRVVSFDKEKRRIGLSMKPWVEGGEEDSAPKGRGKRERRGREEEDDSLFQLNEEELAELSVTIEPPGITVLSPFEAALARADGKAAAKAAGKRYENAL